MYLCSAIASSATGTIWVSRMLFLITNKLTRMKNKYYDLVDQTFDFPQDEFRTEDGELYYHDIPLMEVIKQYGTPLKITYLPKITSQIQRAKRMFNVAIAKTDYKGTYNYCYCTKSSHFSFVLEEALKNDINLETSSAFDINLIQELYAQGLVTKDIFIVCNGYKRLQYIENIVALHSDATWCLFSTIKTSTTLSTACFKTQSSPCHSASA